MLEILKSLVEWSFHIYFSFAILIFILSFPVGIVLGIVDLVGKKFYFFKYFLIFLAFITVPIIVGFVIMLVLSFIKALLGS